MTKEELFLSVAIEAVELIDKGYYECKPTKENVERIEAIKKHYNIKYPQDSEDEDLEACYERLEKLQKDTLDYLIKLRKNVQ